MRAELLMRTWLLTVLLGCALSCAPPEPAAGDQAEPPCPEGQQRGPLGGCVRAPRECDVCATARDCKGLECREIDGCFVCARPDTPSPPSAPSCDVECGSDANCCTGFVCAAVAAHTCEGGCNITIPSRCEDDSGCMDGARCLQTHQACECGTHFDCFARCPATGCPEGQLCSGAGVCVERLCDQGFLCPDGRECHGPGLEPDLHGCTAKACTGDADCGTATCVGGRCHSAGRCVRPD